MGTDRVAIAFANWMEAHKAHIEAEKRLAIACRVAWKMGMQPPEDLVREVDALREEAQRLLAVAEAELRRAKPLK